MQISMVCRCGAKLKVREELAGKQGRCPSCASVLVIPDADLVAPEPPVAVLPPPSAPTGDPLSVLAATVPPPPGPDERGGTQPSESRRRPVLALAASSGLVMVVVVLGLAVWLSRGQGESRPTTGPPKSTAPTAVAAIPPPDRPLSTEEIVSRCERSVCLVDGSHSSGTGFIVLPGIVVTNAHVIDDEFAEDLKVSFPSTEGPDRGPFAAEVVAFDPDRDLAMLRVPTDLPPLTVARSHQFRRGESVTIIGSPGLGHRGLTLENAVTQGVLSTRVTLGSQEYYQLGAAINHGNSGGPVFDSRGRVIGVATLMASEQEGLSFCVPAKHLCKAVDQVASQSDSDAQTAAIVHIASVTSSPEFLKAILERAAPEHALAILDARGFVAKTDPAVSRFRSLLDEVHRGYKQTDAELVRVTLHFLVEMDHHGIKSSCEEILSAMVAIFPDRSMTPAAGEDYSEVGAIYITSRIEDHQSNAQAIASIRAVARALRSVGDQDADARPTPSVASAPARSRPVQRPLKALGSKSKGKSKKRRPTLDEFDVSQFGKPRPAVPTPGVDFKFGITVQGRVVEPIRYSPPKGRPSRYGEALEPVEIGLGSGVTARNIRGGLAGHNWLVCIGEGQPAALLSDAEFRRCVRTD